MNLTSSIGKTLTVLRHFNPYGESPERECYEWFWASINMDDTLPKELLEELYQRMDDVDTGKVSNVC